MRMDEVSVLHRYKEMELGGAGTHQHHVANRYRPIGRFQPAGWNTGKPRLDVRIAQSVVTGNLGRPADRGQRSRNHSHAVESSFGISAMQPERGPGQRFCGSRERGAVHERIDG
ncbi:hypothetical protein [Altericroceibacterium xinjiangense]|uniref:hypothetical protein n=1 Tax=Altericroceibacterium xinjiangense TaxID=762261 RepID=UPI0013DF85CB|nr:hypothetical protein [Altericroceibacterium xinjiangense]